MRTVDLFAGCGGLSLGLQMAGFELVAAYENWNSAANIYKQNFNHPVFELDLSNVEISVNHIKKFAAEIIVGGPPCQDFSSAGKRNENGGRADLTLSFAQIVIGIKPQWFVMENVERINKTEVFGIVRNLFREAGYGLTEMVLDASRCGVPQKRKRMFLIGKLDTFDNFLKNKLLSGLSRSSLTIREYMGSELEIEHYYRHARSYSRRGIFSIDEPSPTIRGVNRPIPPLYTPHIGDTKTNLTDVRPLTAIERSYVQTFPKNFNWNGVNKTVLEQIIGNAVPVNLAKYVGNCIIAYNENENGILNLVNEDSLLKNDSFYL